MAVWKVLYDSDVYDCVYLSDPSADYTYTKVFDSDKFGHQRMGDSWTPVAVAVERGEKPGDFPSLPGGIPPVFRQRALDILHPLIADNIEALPLHCETEKLYAINVLAVADCLDHSRSQFERFPDGRIMMVDKYVFLEGCLDKHIFRIPELKVTIFVSDNFKMLVENSKLEGLIFKQVA